MNLDDLRAELDARANSIDPQPTGRMAGIRHKIAQRRRRKAGATVAASVLAVGAIIGVPVATHLNTAPEPAKGGPFPEKIDGDTKIASVMGDEGDKTVKLTFTPEDTDFLLMFECDDLAPIGDGPLARARAPYLVVDVNQQHVNPPCGQQYDQGSSSGIVGGVATRDSVREFWAEGSVRPGKPVTVTVRIGKGLGQGSRLDPFKGSIGVAAYDMTGDRIERNGVAFPKEKTIGGDTYELGGFDVPEDGGTSASIAIPDLDSPALVTYGATQEYLGMKGKVTVDGRRDVLTARGGISHERLPDKDAHTVEIDYEPAPSKGPGVVVAYYTRAEDDADTDPPELSFPDTTDARDPLIASDVGEPGETVFRSTFTPQDANIAVEKACTLGGQESNDVWVRMTMNGRHTLSGECQSYDGVMSRGDSPEENRAAWRDFGVVAGEPVDVVIRARAKNGADVSLDDLQLGFGVYERSAPRTNVDGFRLDDCQRWNGRWYELADYDTVEITPENREATLSDLTGRDDVLVGVGARGVNGTVRELVNGRVNGSEVVRAASGPALGLEHVSGSVRELGARAGRNVDAGHLVVAYYVPE